jgi:hypothetical protein
VGWQVSAWAALPLFTPPHSDLETSLESARSIEQHVARLERRVLDAIADAGERGLCDHEIEGITGLMHTTASARRRGLVIKGLVVETGERRTTPSGRSAKAWRVK